MFVNLTIPRRVFLLSILLVPGLPFVADAQMKPCPVLYKTYKDNRETNPDLAYEAASQFLARCNNRDRTVKAWMDAYEKSAYEEPAKKPEPLPPAARTDPAETPAGRAVVSSGRYYALVIGNNSYRHLPKLETAVADARVVDSILRERYGFETKLLLNAGRQEVFSAISFYRQKLDQNDNLLVYYAGHGHFDREADKAYWLPVDARREDSANWVSADDITSNVKAIPARHVLIVSDSCYSGTIYRSLGITAADTSERDRFLQKMHAGKSRTLMASGGNEPVADGGGDGHSVFARVFLTGLTKMERATFTGAELFRDFVQERVAGKADQTPEYNPLRNSGHESGDFVFVRKAASKQP
jgi:caspase domain-containing protein